MTVSAAPPALLESLRQKLAIVSAEGILRLRLTPDAREEDGCLKGGIDVAAVDGSGTEHLIEERSLDDVRYENDAIAILSDALSAALATHETWFKEST